MSNSDQNPEQDEIVIRLKRNAERPPRAQYRVVAKNGILKNGTLYKAGTEVSLDADTADNFISLGEVENV
jgi:hypothetical protein